MTSAVGPSGPSPAVTTVVTPVAPPAATPRCAVIGEALADVFPQHIVIGGAPFNLARNLAALGQAPLMVTRLGRDELAQRIREECMRFGLSTQAVQHDDQRPTGVVKVLIEGKEHRFEIGRDQAWDAIERDAAVQAVKAWQPQIVCFGSLAQRSDASREAIRAVLEATPALRFLDLNLRDAPDNESVSRDSLQLAQIVKVNDDELDQVLQWFVHPGQAAAPWGSAALDSAVRQLMARFELQQLIVTRGNRGYAAYDASGQRVAEGPVPQVAVQDTVGAGDAFSSIAVLGRLLGWPLALTLQRASEFAASVCTLRGAVTSERRFYQAWLSQWHASTPALTTSAGNTP